MRYTGRNNDFFHSAFVAHQNAILTGCVSENVGMDSHRKWVNFIGMDNVTFPSASLQLKRKPGRPAKITPEVIDRIARLIAKGMTEEQACVRIGVNHHSLRTARSRNDEFEAAIKRAQAEYLDESLDMIGSGVRGWQGRAWILERRHKPQFNRTPDVVNNSDTESDLDYLTEEQLMAIVWGSEKAREWIQEKNGNLLPGGTPPTPQGEVVVEECASPAGFTG